jgi:hypothetical protein
VIAARVADQRGLPAWERPICAIVARAARTVRLIGFDAFTGATPLIRREELKRRFNADPAKDPLRILICTDAGARRHIFGRQRARSVSRRQFHC